MASSQGAARGGQEAGQVIAGQSLSERIVAAYDDLTRNERRLADLLLENPDILVLHSATEISGLVSVSKATTARFFQRLGYPSFKTAQKTAKGERDGTPTVDGEKLSRFIGKQSDISEHLGSEIQNLVRSIEQLRSDEISSAIQALARSDKLWVVGFGDNYPLAHFARSLLIRVKADIRMIPIGGFSIPEEFASIRQTDAVIALGVGRKTRNLRSLMRSAIRAGAQVVFITDQASRAGPDVASVTLRCRTRGAGVFDSVVAPVSVVTYLCSALAVRMGQTAIERLQYIEQIHDEWGDMLSNDL